MTWALAPSYLKPEPESTLCERRISHLLKRICYSVSFFVVMLHYYFSDYGEGWRLLKRLNPMYLFALVLSQEPVVQ